MNNKNISSDRLFLACCFVFSWMAVFNIAVMNGDDVVHYARGLRSAMLPEIHSSWTPNRVVDIYGRTIFSSLFGWFFYSVNNFYNISFFALYKFFSASVFAVFFTGVMSYLLKNIPRIDSNKAFDIVIRVLLLAALFQLLYWRNQVHFICYQLPACMTFVLLKMTLESREKTLSTADLTVFLLLSYVCAFSLEAYTLIIFVFSALLLVAALGSTVGWHPYTIFAYFKNASHPKLLLTNLIFCGISLLITVLFSERSKPASNVSYMLGFKALPGAAILFASIVLLAVGCWFFWCRARGMSAIDSHDRKTLFFPIYTGGVTLVVTYLISVKTNTNYFNLSDYPWGDLMLVGKLSLLLLMALGIIQLTKRYEKMQPLLTLVCIIALSKLGYLAIERINADSAYSVVVGQAYVEMIHTHLAVVKTGLDLDALPMQTRPLPTASSPQWFIDAYKLTFEKFCNLKSMPLFQ